MGACFSTCCEAPSKFSTFSAFTRPLGASFGDLLSQPTDYGGLGFGTTVTSFLFLAAIVAIVVYMTLMKRGDDALAATEAD